LVLLLYSRSVVMEDLASQAGANARCRRRQPHRPNIHYILSRYDGAVKLSGPAVKAR
jgi:hypothetical protein